MTKLLFGTLLTIFALISQHPAQQSNLIVGKWTGTDDLGNTILIEFSPEGKYILHVNGMPLTEDLPETGPIRYRIDQQTQNELHIKLYDKEAPEGLIQLQANLQGEEKMELLTEMPQTYQLQLERLP